ncbi:MAG: VCBS repeat-containing protein [Candidatus Limnocylindrales bacterium]
MPRFPRSKRVPVIALGLSLLLLIDGLAVGSGHAVLGAKDGSGRDEGGRITSATTQDGEAVVCAQGFVEVDSASNMSLHGVTQTGKNAIAVGYARRSTPGHNGVRAPATMINRGSGWERVPASSPGDEDGLMAVAWRDDAETWAVGFTTDGPAVRPLAMRFNGAEWKVDKPAVNAEVGVFIDVTIVGDGSPFAVGYRMGESGRRKPLVIRKDGPRWRSTPMSVGRTESLTLTGVSPDKKGGTWVVGHGGKGAEVKARIWNRDAGRWRQLKLPKLKGESVLTDVVATFGDLSWAVGYHKADGATKPLVLRWNGKRWTKFKAPRWDTNDAILNAVSVDPAGGIWVVGAAWNDERKAHEAVAAWWDGRAWNEVAGGAGGDELHEAVGSLSTDGWAVGRANDTGRAVRVCTPPQAGVFGISEPVADDESLVVQDPDPDEDTGDEFEADDLEHEFHPDIVAENRKAGKKAVKIKSKIGTLPVAEVLPGLVAKDVARPAGVFEETGTYDAVVEDFDGDGVDDLFIGRHGKKGLLLLNRSGVFTEHEALQMTSIDRHGCTAADVDGSGLPDLYCTVGGKRGSGLKSNELWLDPGGPAPVEVASEWGAADASGRGRLAVFLDGPNQEAIDLVVTNTPTRVDGLPSLSRLFRTKAGRTLKAKASPGIAARLGARALQDADFDGDGREDVLLVTGGPQTPGAGSTRLYRNTSKGLVDVTRKMGIKSFDEMDAELVDLDGDKKLDLVQLSERKLKVSIQKKGRFKKVFERNLTGGRAIAAGDVNGDGRDDLYLMRSETDKNVPDVMLVNRKKGRKWVSMVIPQVSDGAGDDAFAVDHDGNGLEDFLVLNGHNARGSTQLIAFYRR